MPRPEVSCVLRVRPGRGDAVRYAIDDFCAQTYQDKQLLVLYNTPFVGASYPEIAAYVKYLDRDDVRAFNYECLADNGQVIRAGVKESSGVMICLWDDETRHHPLRLEHQAEAASVSGAVGSCLSSQFYFNPDGRRVWRIEGRYGMGGCNGLLPSTLLYVRQDLPSSAYECPRVMFQAVARFGKVEPVSDRPHLAVRVYTPRRFGGDPVDFTREVSERAEGAATLRADLDFDRVAVDLRFVAEDVNVLGRFDQPVGLPRRAT